MSLFDTNIVILPDYLMIPKDIYNLLASEFGFFVIREISLVRLSDLRQTRSLTFYRPEVDRYEAQYNQIMSFVNHTPRATSSVYEVTEDSLVTIQDF